MDQNCLLYLNRYDDLMNYCNSTSISVVLVGIKRDSSARVVSTERAQSFADHLNLPYFEVSLDNNSEISDVFDNLVKTVAQTLLSRENTISASTLSTTRLSKAVIKAESKLGCSCCQLQTKDQPVSFLLMCQVCILLHFICDQNLVVFIIIPIDRQFITITTLCSWLSQLLHLNVILLH